MEVDIRNYIVFVKPIQVFKGLYTAPNFKIKISISLKMHWINVCKISAKKSVQMTISHFPVLF